MGQLPRESRITTRREIRRLLASPRARGPALELFRGAPAEGAARGTCITPRHGRTAVERNRLRRRLKELIRARLLGRAEPFDWLVRAHPPAYDLDYAALGGELEALADRLARPASRTPNEAS